MTDDDMQDIPHSDVERSSRQHVSRRSYLSGAVGSIGMFGLSKIRSSDQEKSSVPPAKLPTTAQIADRADLGTSGIPHILTWGGSSIYYARKGFEKGANETAASVVPGLHPDAWWGTSLSFWRGPPTQQGNNRWYDGIGDKRYLEDTGRYGYTPVFGFGPKWETLESGAPIDWYEKLPADEKFERPDGTVVEYLTELCSKDIYGERRVTEQEHEGNAYYEYYPSMYAPGFQKYLKALGADLPNKGIKGLWVDNVYYWQNNRDFSTWSNTSFKNHLQSLSQDELDRLGIDSITAFNLRSALRENTPLDGKRNPATDPLFREFVKHEVDVFEKIFAILNESITSTLQEDEEAPITFANQNVKYPEMTAVAVNKMTTAATEAQRTFPPDHIHDFNQKFLVAAGRFEKSGLHFGSPLEEPEVIDAIEASELNLSKVQPALLRILFAEELSNGCIGSAHFHGNCCYGTIQEQPMNWLRSDGSLPDELRSLTGFAWSLREFLRGGSFAHDTAVVMSLPTFMWNRAPSWDRGTDDLLASFSGAASLVRESGDPYDVLLFGHPDVWDDSVMLDRLETYDRLVLPSVISISATQLSALETALNDGATVIITDDRPQRDEEYEPLSDSRVDDLFSHPNLYIIDSYAARQYWNDEADGEKLRQILQRQRPLVEVEVDSPIGRTVQTQNSPSRVVVQLVNYDLDHASGTVSSIADYQLSLRDSFEFEISEARFYRPGEPSIQIDVENKDRRICLQLPQTDAWGILVLGPTESAVSLAGDPEVVDSDINTAEEVISTAVDGGASDSELESSRWFLQYARDARENEAYSLAENYAERAATTARHFIDSDDANGTDSSTATENDGDSTPTTDDAGSGTSTDDDVAGFGVSAALAGISTTAYLLKRRLSRTEMKSE